MTSSLARKGTILIPSDSKSHLHFVCSDQIFLREKGKKYVLLVNISSIKNNFHYDTTCTLDVGDHPFITKQSFVYYRKAEIYSVTGINAEIEQGNYTIKENCSIDVFQRILQGFAISKDVKRKIYNFYKKHC
jgi:hypothetical protein